MAKLMCEPYLVLQKYADGEFDLILNCIVDNESKEFSITAMAFEELIKQFNYFVSTNEELKNDENQ